MTTLNWKKSTRSNAGNCVEVATPPRVVMVRDSKDQQGPVLTFTTAQWGGFIQGIRGGTLDV